MLTIDIAEILANLDEVSMMQTDKIRHSSIKCGKIRSKGNSQLFEGQILMALHCKYISLMEIVTISKFELSSDFQSDEVGTNQAKIYSKYLDG